jgi:hypothetical protein
VPRRRCAMLRCGNPFTWILWSRDLELAGLTPSIRRGHLEQDAFRLLRGKPRRVAGDVGGAARDGAGVHRRRVGVAETTCTSSVAMPSSSAAICARTVSDPWPVSTVPVSRVAVPSSLTLTHRALGLAATVKPMGYHMQAMPRPRRLTTAPRPVSSRSARPQLQRLPYHHAVQPGRSGSSDPSENALSSRMSSGSMPSAFAMSSMCDS